MTPLLARLAAAGTLLWAIGAAHAADAIVYMKPDGNEQASGKSAAEAIGTLQTAIKRVLEMPVGPSGERKVIILPGTYKGQTTTVSDLPDDKPLVITGSSGAGQRPVFDGDGKGRTWFQLDGASGRNTRLTIEGIEVANYVTAISLNGNRDAPGNYNAENVIHLNMFRDIGQIAFPKGKPSTAAVRLVNSRNNRITENRFINIRNVTGCSALHSIYMAHYSTGNLIEKNTFDGGCGATVKTRDSSGSNVVKGNRFIDQSEPVFLDSFCNKDARGDCTKATSECPSWGNEFADNSTSGLKGKAAKKAVEVSGPDAVAGCQPPPATRSRRLLEANNRSNDR